jgi:cytochrome c oxidase assembly protein subunit 11
VRFNADVASGLPWDFRPAQREVALRVGETGMAYYTAENNASEAIIGTASYNVTPLKAGPYFSKIDCFCFTEQELAPGELAELPVTFFVDPEIADDKNLDDVKTITLSYTFFDKNRNQARAKPQEGSSEASTQVASLKQTHDAHQGEIHSTHSENKLGD